MMLAAAFLVGPAAQEVDQEKVDDAVRRGATFLLQKYERGFDETWWSSSLELDGSWWTGLPGVQWKQAGDIETADTCFAILFLTKATPPLTISEDPRKK